VCFGSIVITSVILSNNNFSTFSGNFQSFVKIFDTIGIFQRTLQILNALNTWIWQNLDCYLCSSYVLVGVKICKQYRVTFLSSATYFAHQLPKAQNVTHMSQAVIASGTWDKSHVRLSQSNSTGYLGNGNDKKKVRTICKNAVLYF
jgi:hypothetical protein